MCGFTISKEKLENRIKHRGVFKTNISLNEWQVNFNSLPLCTYNTNLQQPLTIGSYTLCFNGEIFNYKELDKRAKSDLEYLRNFIKKYNSPEKLYKESNKWDGFWSIALVRNTKVYFFSDLLGKKQLYFNNEGISSEIKTFNNTGYLKGYDENKFGTLNTNFDKILRALPGVLYIYDIRNDLASRLYYNKYDLKSPDENLYDIIDQSVKDRLENKYDGLSLLLSGGLDSNIILHHALKYTDNINIISIENDEKENILKIQNDLNLEINYINDSFTENDINRAVYFYEHDLDYGSLIPNYLLFKNCENSLVLTGDGSDELFGGYERNKKNDTWKYDVFKELPYYHNIRLDRMSMAFTKEARNPLMSYPLLKYSSNLSWKQRKNKQILRDCYKDILPDYITEGKKKPLRLENDKQKNMDLVKEVHRKLFKDKL